MARSGSRSLRSWAQRRVCGRHRLAGATLTPGSRCLAGEEFDEGRGAVHGRAHRAGRDAPASRRLFSNSGRARRSLLDIDGSRCIVTQPAIVDVDVGVTRREREDLRVRFSRSSSRSPISTWNCHPSNDRNAVRTRPTKGSGHRRPRSGVVAALVPNEPAGVGHSPSGLSISERSRYWLPISRRRRPPQRFQQILDVRLVITEHREAVALSRPVVPPPLPSRRRCPSGLATAGCSHTC